MPWPASASKLGRGRHLEAALGGGREQRGGERVLGAALGRRREAQDLVLGSRRRVTVRASTEARRRSVQQHDVGDARACPR